MPSTATSIQTVGGCICTSWRPGSIGGRPAASIVAQAQFPTPTDFDRGQLLAHVARHGSGRHGRAHAALSVGGWPTQGLSELLLAPLGLAADQLVWIDAKGLAVRLWVTQQPIKSDAVGAVLA